MLTVELKNITLCLAASVGFFLSGHAGHCSAACSPLKGVDLSVSIVRGETSKDSHEWKKKAVLNGCDLKYLGPYGNCDRGQCPHKEVSIRLSPDQAEKLVNAIEQVNLPESFRESRKTGGLGQYAKATMQISGHGRPVEMDLAGMTNLWSKGGDPDKSLLSADARRHLASIERLIAVLTGFAKGSSTEFH